MNCIPPPGNPARPCRPNIRVPHFAILLIPLDLFRFFSHHLQYKQNAEDYICLIFKE